MIFRSLVASAILAGQITSGSASAQVLLCPEAPQTNIAPADMRAEAERLLRRLTVALDLHGHRGISEDGIMQAHADTPSALLDKLTNVVNRCAMSAGDLEEFYLALPDIRKSFLEATNIADSMEIDVGSDIKSVALDASEAERVEQSIELSVRELWRKLWFRPAASVAGTDDRWAVIVASPMDAESGWDELGKHQRRWKDAYFQLHIPYYDSNPHHAIVIGRRLPEDQARQLRNYAVELGMADDAYLWELPKDNLEQGISAFDVSDIVDTEDDYKRRDLDLSILKR